MRAAHGAPEKLLHSSSLTTQHHRACSNASCGRKHTGMISCRRRSDPCTCTPQSWRSLSWHEGHLYQTTLRSFIDPFFVLLALLAVSHEGTTSSIRMSESVGSPSVSLAPRLQLPATCDPPSESNPPMQKVWIIFGATGHMGRSLTKAALAHGDKVTAVGKTFEHSIKQMQGWHDNCLGLLCDVRVPETVDAVIKNSIQHFGGVDIIAKYVPYIFRLEKLLTGPAALATESLAHVRIKTSVTCAHSSKPISSAA